MKQILLLSQVNPHEIVDPSQQQQQTLELDSKSAHPSSPQIFDKTNSIFVCNNNVFLCVQLELLDTCATYLNGIDVVPGSIIGLHKGDIIHMTRINLWCVYDALLQQQQQQQPPPPPLQPPSPSSSPPPSQPPAPSPFNYDLLVHTPLFSMEDFNSNFSSSTSTVTINFLRHHCSIDEFKYIVDAVRHVNNAHVYDIDLESSKLIEFSLNRLDNDAEKLFGIVEHYGNVSRFMTAIEKLMNNNKPATAAAIASPPPPPQVLLEPTTVVTKRKRSSASATTRKRRRY